MLTAGTVGVVLCFEKIATPYPSKVCFCTLYPNKGCCCAQTFWAKTVEDRAKIDLKFHFMKKTLNEVVSCCVDAGVAVHKLPCECWEN